MPINAERAKVCYKTYLDNDSNVEKAADALQITTDTLTRYIRFYKEVNGLSNWRVNKGQKRVLIFDIETAPIEAYVWSLWKQNVATSQIIEDWSVLCWAAKWLDGTEIYTSASWRDGDNVRDDKACCLALAALLDEADIVVAHNGDKFDIKKMNTRFLYHGIQEPTPFKSIDTLKIVKHRFAITSNRLDYIGEFLNLGRKVAHNGFGLWKGVLHGDTDSQDTMLRYNVGDITLLEQVYLKVRAWDKRCPNINLEFDVRQCPCCGSDKLKVVGECYTNVSTFTTMQCVTCGKYSRSGYNKKTKDQMVVTQRNIT